MSIRWQFSAEWLRIKWGWVVCVASFVIHVGMFALGYTYSLFFVEIQHELNATAVETGWIGSVVFGVQMFSSPIGSFLESCFGYRITIILIVTVASIAIFVSSFAQTVQQLYVTLGVIYGLSLGIAWFVMLSVMVQYFPTKNSVRAVSFATMGATLAMLIISEPVSISIEAMGWRSTLQFIAAFTLVISLPPAFLIFSPSVNDGVETGRSSSYENFDSLKASERETTNEKENIKQGLSKPCDYEQLPGDRLTIQQAKNIEYEGDLTSVPQRRSRLERWKTAISIDAFLYSAFTITCAMSWSVFFVNIVSYYDSVGLEIYQSATLLTISCVMELATKMVLATLGERFPYKKTYLLLIKIIMVAVLSVMMVLATTFWYFVILTMVTGSLRACFNVLLYPCAIETFGKNCSDEAIIIVSVSRGIGFLTGTIPAGAIYDAMGSYRLSFLLVAAISTFSAAALSMTLLCPMGSKKHTVKLKITHQRRTTGIPEGCYRKSRRETSV